MTSSPPGVQRAGKALPPGLLVRSANVLRRLDRSVRETRRMVKELERSLDFELWGRYNISSFELIDDEIAGEVVELLRRARMEHPGQELEIIFVALQGEEEDDGAGNVQRRHAGE